MEISSLLRERVKARKELFDGKQAGVHVTRRLFNFTCSIPGDGI